MARTERAGRRHRRRLPRPAAKYKVNSVNVNSCWAALAKKELEGTGVGPSAVIAFPYGACISKVKYLELEEMVNLGCTACDMVVNIGALKDKNYDLVTEEIKKFVEICKPANCDTKLIFEVGFLTDDEIATLTKICCEQGVSYVKTATGSQAFPTMQQVQIMKANLSGDTKIKVSGVPRTFTLPAAMFMFDHMASASSAPAAPARSCRNTRITSRRSNGLRQDLSLSPIYLHNRAAAGFSAAALGAPGGGSSCGIEKSGRKKYDENKIRQGPLMGRRAERRRCDGRKSERPAFFAARAFKRASALIAAGGNIPLG